MKTRSLSELRQDSKPAESKHEQVAMSIDESGVEHLMGTLTNLYSNPPVAVFREYVSNALDSHIKSKQKKPIEIEITRGREVKQRYGMPSVYEDQELIVRDFGVGLSKNDVINVYSRYASSTKRDSNEQVGAFGLGAKSALAITDRFDVVSVKDKVKLEFFIEKNEKGVGIVNFVSETPTKEANGVTVTIPLRNADANQIRHEVGRQGFFLTWKPETYVLKGNFENWSAEKSAYNSEKYFTVYEGEEVIGWVSYGTRKSLLSYNRASYGMPNISIAGIGYGIDYTGRNSINSILQSKSGKFLTNAVNTYHDVIINMPIGSLDLTPSREQIMFTDKSIKAFQSAFNRFQELLVSELEAHISQLDTKEALEFYFANMSLFSDEYIDPQSPYYKSTKTTLGNLYQGQQIPLLVMLDQPVWKISAPTFTSWGTEGKVNQISLFEAAIDAKHTQHNPYRFDRAFRDNVAHILVYGKTPNRTDLKEEFARLKRNARSYSQSIHDDYDRRLVEVYYYDSNTKPENIWLDAAMEVVHIDELEKIGKAYRSEIARDKAKNATRSKRETAIHFGIVSDINGVVSTPKLFSPDELSKIKNIVILDQATINRPRALGRAGIYELIWDNYLTTLKSSVVEFDKMAAHLGMAFKDTTILFVPKSRKLGPIQKANPNAKTLTQHVNAMLDSYSTRSKEYKELMAHLSIPTNAQSSNDLVNYLGSNKVIDLIEDDFAKEVFSQQYSGGEQASLAYVISFFYNFKESVSSREVQDMYCHKLLTKTWHSVFATNKNWWQKYSIFSDGNDDNSLAKTYVQAINAIS
jgi:hypothetical protein